MGKMIFISIAVCLFLSGCGGSSKTTVTTVQMGGAIQGNPLALTNTVTTIAGQAGSQGSADGTGASASFAWPEGITTDGANLYIVDMGNDTIRRMVLSTGVVTTIAGTAGTQGSADGTGTSATFYGPHGITTDGANLYIADTFNDTIRKMVVSTGVVTTIAGHAGISGSADGTGTNATFYQPTGITTDGTSLYITDGNDTIRKMVVSTGVVTTIAGQVGVQGHADGTGTSATFWAPTDITTDGANLYIVDLQNDTVRKMVVSTGVVTTIAGTAGTQGSADGTGTSATFYRPWSITTDGANLYIVDMGNDTIRKMVLSTGVVTTIAGTAGMQGHADGTGTSATFDGPIGVTTDGNSLFVSDTLNETIRQIK